MFYIYEGFFIFEFFYWLFENVYYRCVMIGINFCGNVRVVMFKLGFFY